MNRDLPLCLTWIFFGIAIVTCMCCSTGCASVKDIPAGTHVQSATFGARFSPTSIDGTPLVVGSHVMAITRLPENGEPYLNRFEGTIPGVRSTTTVAGGNGVGGEIKDAGGPELLKRGQPINEPE